MLAAFAVLVSHSFALATGSAANEPLRTILGITPGHIAVDVFFITSGLLVARSLFYRRNLLEFTVARALRIYPGLIVAVLVCIIAGALTSSMALNDYFLSPTTLDFLLKNSFMLLGDVQELPGVFSNAPFDNSVNGSLWTLPWELRMYIFLGVFGLITLLLNFIYKANWLVIFVTCFFIFCAINYLELHYFTEIRSQNYRLYRFGTLFFSGAVIYIFRSHILFNKKIFWVSILSLIITSFNHDIFFALYTLLLPYIVLYLAYIPSGKIRNYNAFGDYSYGIYIYAWPVQQLIAINITDITPIEMIIYSASITFFCAYASWHLVESKAIRLKKYIKAHALFDIDRKITVKAK